MGIVGWLHASTKKRPHTGAIQTTERFPSSIVGLRETGLFQSLGVNKRRATHLRKPDAEERAQDRVEENQGISKRETVTELNAAEVTVWRAPHAQTLYPYH
jgi:hypothetical protein